MPNDATTRRENMFNCLTGKGKSHIKVAEKLNRRDIEL